MPESERRGARQVVVSPAQGKQFKAPFLGYLKAAITFTRLFLCGLLQRPMCFGHHSHLPSRLTVNAASYVSQRSFWRRDITIAYLEMLVGTPGCI